MGLKEDKLIKKKKMINEIARQYFEIIQQHNDNLENLRTKLTSAFEIMIDANKNWQRIEFKNKIPIFIAQLMDQMIKLGIDNNILYIFAYILI
ncbi:unnamed protein product [Paramecium pentaurelia]|uniref:Uncharacterized protein n=1 Tax=Paramecium pentaurelia TaxID=43138 RepID=A0A8S1TTE1_9CILI|nr:unnamed protein product [Paramecium pentaurelia]